MAISDRVKANKNILRNANNTRIKIFYAKCPNTFVSPDLSRVEKLFQWSCKFEKFTTLTTILYVSRSNLQIISYDSVYDILMCQNWKFDRSLQIPSKKQKLESDNESSVSSSLYIRPC